MPDFNNRPISIGAGVTVVAPAFDSPRHIFDCLHGTVVAMFPGTPSAWVEVRFDDRSRDNALFEGYELLLDETPKRRSLV